MGLVLNGMIVGHISSQLSVANNEEPVVLYNAKVINILLKCYQAYFTDLIVIIVNVIIIMTMKTPLKNYGYAVCYKR